MCQGSRYWSTSKSYNLQDTLPLLLNTRSTDRGTKTIVLPTSNTVAYVRTSQLKRIMMPKIFALFLAGLAVASSFQPSTQFSCTSTLLAAATSNYETEQSRLDFLKTSSLMIGAGACTLIANPSPSLARGRATLDQSYDRYTPRIIAGGEFYGGSFRKLIEKGDWAGIKNALAEPPKRSKEDKAKIDGGIAERAAQAGQFSDARVIVASDLFAAAFSDNSVSPKTKKMKAQVEVLREVVSEMLLTARQGLGEVGGGGFFGIGGKKPSQAELAKKIRELYIKGGNAYNQYIFAANEELPLEFKKLPYLK